ncbi:hypothetical protein ACGFZA_07790 [Streptomyces sp. NPDC048211]
MTSSEPQTDGDQLPQPDHSECIGPHLAPDGEHIDCDGNLL